jgi:hypothetical protein
MGDFIHHNKACIQTVEVGHYLVEVEVEESYYKESAILLQVI